MLHETRPDDRHSVEQQQVMHSWGRVVAQIDEALFSVDRAWRFVSVNERLTSIWGRSEEELLGKVMWSEFPSLRGSRFEELYLQAMNDGKATSFEAFSATTQAWYEVRAYPIRQGLIVHFRECTRRKQLEQLLQGSEARFRALSDASLEGVLIHDGAVVLDANQIAVDLYGYRSLDELIGQPIRELIAPESWEAVQQNITTGSEDAYEYIARRKDGSRFVAEVRAKWVIYQNQPRRIGAFRDITEQKRAEAQRLQVQKRESIVRLAAGVAHEFNNRLAVMLSSTELALRELPEHSPAARDLQESIRAIHSAAHLVKQLLAFAREHPPDLQAVNLNEVLREIEPLLRHLLPEATALRIVLDPQLPEVCADVVAIQQVLMNLVANARDALPDGGSITIVTGVCVLNPADVARLGERRPGRYVSVSIHDTGIGIDEQTLQHLFEPFFTTKEPGKGTGLGLAVSYGLIKEHGGFLTCSSALGQGTTFTIYLPSPDQNAYTTQAY